MGGNLRESYLNAGKLIKMCRVCLTHSNNVMFSLTDYLDLDDSNEVPILDALEKVVSTKILINENYPQCICPMCMSMLRMSYKFIIQFEKSHNWLNSSSRIDQSSTYEHELPHSPFNKLEYEDDEHSVQNKSNESPVEIIIGKQKFSLNDLLIVEEPEKEDRNNFNGFLKNLGEEISATFVDKSTSKTPSERQCEDAVSIFMALNENNVLPVRELKIDDETNTINYIVLEDNSDKDVESKSEEDGELRDEGIEEYQDMECIKIETSDKDIESFIIKVEGGGNERDKGNETVSRTIMRKPTKRKKIIVERESDGVIIMEPLETGESNEAPQEEPENEDEIFEREIRFPCELCKKNISDKASNEGACYVHHRLKHKGKQFVCEVCNKTYYTRAVLKVHMATHVNNRQHLCSVCGKGFNYPNALEYHMRLHTGEKRYKCEYCGEQFRMPNSLKRHIRTHTGEKPYKCSFCQRAFSSRGEVQCHENIHTGYRPYHCKFCGKGFTKTHNLKLHLLSHGGPHKCDFCGKSFIQLSILAMHCKIAHKNLIQTLEEEEDERIDWTYFK
ncbi:hypothetical protein NQ315_016885 [Exocentrus adspersus]|uniref:Uncharacterized protein n=1 Tax=Exocentrus adspersus TaxID=1586481 RepID=A0AAV8VYM8_9CUCU|nr:hypothetical protein NQ315_016885 [Exocentrus adspersus]